MFTLIIFILVLALLVLSHEFGHFIVARKNGIKVEEFGFGFPPRLFGIQVFKEEKITELAKAEEIEVLEDGTIKDEVVEIDDVKIKRRWRFVWGNKDVEKLVEENKGRNGTIYSVNWIPLGGFVKIHGEDGGYVNDPNSFSAKKIWRRATVLVAGVIMNVIVAVILLSIGYMIGLPQAMGDSEADGAATKDRRLEIMQVMPSMPAGTAGVKVGDVVLKIDNISSPSVKQFQEYVNTRKDHEIKLTLSRNGEALEKKITPTTLAETGRGGIGVSIVEIGSVSYPWYKAIWYGILTTGFYLKEIVLALYLLVKGLIFGAGAGAAVSGPVGVAVMTGQAARLGLAYLLQFAAMLSLNLAVFNILPIPALDGGRLIFLGIEKIIGRPVNRKWEQIIHGVGFILLMALVLVVTVRDLGAFRGAVVNFFQKIF